MPSAYDYAGSTALVTGASSGIGLELARLLARRGVRRLILVARSGDKLDALAAELRAEHGPAAMTVLALPADLSDPNAPAQIKAATDAHNLVVDLLVNNAGFGSYGVFDERPPERETQMVDLNVRAVVDLTRLFLPGIVARGRGGVLNVSSTAAFQPVPFMATYGATKAFVLSFSEALWAENRSRAGKDIRVVCLCPGGTDTAFDFGSSQARGQFEKMPQATPQDVARAGQDALDKNASFVAPGAANYAGTLLPRLAPRALIARTTARLFRPETANGYDKKSAAPAVIAGAALALLAGAALLLAHRRKE